MSWCSDGVQCSGNMWLKLENKDSICGLTCGGMNDDMIEIVVQEGNARPYNVPKVVLEDKTGGWCVQREVVVWWV